MSKRYNQSVSPARRTAGAARSRSKDGATAWRRILLSLTLVPLVAGLLLIVAWALGFYPFASSENQIVVGTLFLLLGFAASNAIQQKWSLAAGWFLLMIADYVILSRLQLWAQAIAMLIGLAGVILIGWEFFRRIAASNKSNKVT